MVSIAAIAVKILLITTFNICYCIDRTKFSNFRATESHDGYMKFKQDINFPLSVKWNKSVSCALLVYPQNSYAVTNNKFYCLTNDFDPMRTGSNSSVLALNVDDGSVIFKTNLNNNSNTNTSFSGIVSIEPNYISVFDDNNAKIYLLNGSTGQIIHETLLYNGCPLNTTSECMVSSLVSSATNHESVIAAYAVNQIPEINHIKFLSWKVESNDISYTNTTPLIDEIDNTPTICNNDMIVVSNQDRAVGAYYINLNNTLSEMWTYYIEFNSDSGVYTEIPVLCVPKLEGGFNALVNVIHNDSMEQQNLQRWNLIDGKTGDLVKEIILNTTITYMPAIHTHKMILVSVTYNAFSNTLVGYNISDSLLWDEIYRIKINPNQGFGDMMIINDNIYLLGRQLGLHNTTHYILNIYSIDNGKYIDTFTIPQDDQKKYDMLSMVAGASKNGVPMIFIMATKSSYYEFEEPIEAILFALG